MQRFFDILFSIAALLVLSIVFVPIVLILRFSGEGEVFFLQERVGLHGRPFKLYKFVTMLKNSPSLGTGTVTVKGDPRILPVGQFLRKSKINEMPQLLNVLFGDMSIIGPRPLTRQAFNAYSKETQDIVTRVRPGLSGIGSIVFRGEEEILAGEDGSMAFYNNVIAPYKGTIERWYVDHYGLKTYFTAIVMTLLVVLSPRSTLAWRAFRDLPAPPERLRTVLNYPF